MSKAAKKPTMVRIHTPGRYFIKGTDKIVVTGSMAYKDIRGYSNPAHRVVLGYKDKKYSFFPGQAFVIPALEPKTRKKEVKEDA